MFVALSMYELLFGNNCVCLRLIENYISVCFSLRRFAYEEKDVLVFKRSTEKSAMWCVHTHT